MRQQRLPTDHPTSLPIDTDESEGGLLDVALTTEMVVVSTMRTEEAEQLLPGRVSEDEDMIAVNEVSKITMIAPAASVFVVVPHRSDVYSNVFFLSSPPSEEAQVVLNDQVFVEAKTDVTRAMTVVVAAGEDNVSKKCKEAGGA